MSHATGVYRLHKLGRAAEGNGFDMHAKRLERNPHVVTTDYAEQINEKSEYNGLYYEFCKKESELYWAKKDFKNATTETVEFEEVDEAKEALVKEYKELTEKDPNKNWGVKKLTEEIEKLKAE